MRPKKFTSDQEKILNLKVGKHLVLAPPGSGKTELLAERFNTAIQNNVPKDRMLCITFTNRAAKNMLDRVGSKHNETPFIGTLHNFGIKFLLKNKIVPTNITLLDEEDSRLLIQDAISELRECDNEIKCLDVNGQKLSNFIRDLTFTQLNIPSNAFVSNVSSSHQLLLTDVNPLSEIESRCFHKIFQKYIQIKNSTCCIDFDDILFLTLKTLIAKKDLEMCDYQWLQVDEVQDLSALQWEILNRITHENCHSIYFGDYDQAIFSFMGASHESLHKFTRNCEKHYLAENFRSPQNLIDLFNTYAEKNFRFKENISQKIRKSNVTSDNGSIKKILISGTFNDEAEEISRKIIPEKLQASKKIAVLSRTNKEAELVSIYLENRKIQHFRVSGFDLFHRKSIKDGMALLRAMRRKDDRLAWARLLSIFSGISSLKASRELINEIQEHGIYPQDYLEKYDQSSYLDSFISDIENQRVIVFDTETSGLNVQDDDIIQIAAIEIINGIQTGNEFEVYIQTNKDLSESSKIHNISNNYLATNGVSPEIGLKKFKDFVNGSILIGHNISKFDLKILSSNLKKHVIDLPINLTNYDTLNLTKRLYPRLTNYTLHNLISLFNLDGRNSHNAIDDVRANVNLLFHLYDQIKKNATDRNKIHNNSKKYFDQFKINFEDFWKDTQISLSKNLNLGDLIDNFFSYSKDKVDYRLKDDEIKYTNKLVNYLRSHWLKNKNFFCLKDMIFSQAALDLLTYAESDLITEDDKLVVSTIHKAKGLEFDSVIITGCVKDNFPHFYSRNIPAAVEEDARLLYVALTRAKSEILITMHDSVSNRGGVFPRYPSPFLNFIN
jgi:DNA helicase-2/ATP-dependent DNA helicase PcrA